MAHHHRPADAFVMFLAVVSASLAISAGDVAAKRTDPPGHDDGNHCVTTDGVDLNVLYGVADQFRNRECQEVTAGEHWIVPLFWIVNFGADAVYPVGYMPARPDPIDDFVSKLVGIKFVIDAGTAAERVLVLPPSVRTDVDAEELQPGLWGAPFPMASMLPRLRPLSVGDHVWQPFVVLSAMHCDGFAANAEENCLPAGETAFSPPRPLVVSVPTG